MLNQQQQQLQQIILEGNFKNLLIKGPAGVGKTYLAADCAKKLLDMKKSVIFAAPTHKACAILKSKMPLGLPVEVITVASLLSRRPWRVGDGNVAFSSAKRNKIDNFDYVFIDEGSMVGEKDGEVLFNSKAKVIMLGDRAQLKPVMQKPNRFWNDAQTFELTIQMRQSGEVFKLANSCRDNVIFPQQSVEGIQVHKTINSMIDKFVETLKSVDNPQDHCFISYKNSTVDHIAKLAHKTLYGDNDFAIGQWLRLESSINIQSKGHNVQIKSIAQNLNSKGKKKDFKTYNLLVTNNNGDEEWIEVVSNKTKKKINYRINYLKEYINKVGKNPKLKIDLLKEIEWLENSWTKIASPFSITCHKSQGSTIPHVWVNTLEMSKAPSKQSLLYVAYGRSSNTLNTVKVLQKNPKIKCQTLTQTVKQVKSMLSKKVVKAITWQVKQSGFSIRQKAGKEKFLELALSADVESIPAPIEGQTITKAVIQVRNLLDKEVIDLIRWELKNLGLTLKQKAGKEKFLELALLF